MAYASKKSGKIRSVLQKAVVFAIIQYIGVFEPIFAQVQNPLGEGSSFTTILKNIAKQATKAALLIAPVFIVIAGLQFLFAGESEQKISQAKKTLWWTLIGAAIVVGAGLLTDAVINTIQGLGT